MCRKYLIKVVQFDNVKQIDDDSGLVSFFAGAFGAGLVGKYLEESLIVNNHILFSTGEIENDEGELRLVSIGAFGHVWTFAKEDVDQMLKEYL